jgi:Flp pilus assembly pilin Flp
MGAVVALVARLKLRRDDGQDLIEYGLLAALIAVVAIFTVNTVGETVNNVLWQTIANAV